MKRIQARLFPFAWCTWAADLPTSVCDVMSHGAKGDMPSPVACFTFALQVLSGTRFGFREPPAP